MDILNVVDESPPRFRAIKSPVASRVTCVRCGKRLLRFDWNRKTDILACDNTKCGLFRQPQGGYRKHERCEADYVPPEESNHVRFRTED